MSPDDDPFAEPGRNERGDTRTVEIAEETLAEETLHVDVVRRATGRVAVRTRTETVDETIDAALESVTAEVRRVAVNRYIEDGESVPRARQVGDTWILPALEEVVVVAKRLLLKEEVPVTQSGEREQVVVPVTLRRQVAEVERAPETETDGADATPAVLGRDE